MEEMYYLCGMIEEQILTELKSGSQHCKMACLTLKNVDQKSTLLWEY